ncbi:hypothetical protein ACZ81_04285 [Alteromonas macleodii]|uniref:M56 family metallopeptidase n=1 Tax=Alteromonas macleodii TaxID=28108 RepID=UPI000776EB29|nr:M56 family metallopeptidase [Alteromonas macleodii]AMN10867.1 hypothetical protein ACZ81_04285 [Alteromonas macleodii]
MLEGLSAITLNLLSIAVLALFVSVIFSSFFIPLLLRGLKKCTLNVQKVTLWVLVTLPWWVALSCITILWPWHSSPVSVSWVERLAHWHHIDVFHFTSWHAITLYGLVLYNTYTAIKGVLLLNTQSRSLQALIALSGEEQRKSDDALHFYSLPVTLPTAFVSGMISPKVYVTEALQKKVSPAQLDIILRHEFAHVKARDPLFRSLFAACTMLFPPPVKRRLIKHYVLLTELIADNTVAQHYDNLEVAQTLIDVARHQQRGIFSNVTSAINYFGNDATTYRVQCLISPRLSSSKGGVGFAITLIALMPFLTASAVDSLHHIIETLFIH